VAMITTLQPNRVRVRTKTSRNFGGFLVAETRRRFVEKQYVRIADQCARDLDAALNAYARSATGTCDHS